MAKKRTKAEPERFRWQVKNAEGKPRGEPFFDTEGNAEAVANGYDQTQPKGAPHVAHELDGDDE